jgi:AraC-like DNA-binding protein
LERYWKKKFGEAPKRWLSKIRMSDAQRLLANGLSIKEAASSLGFKQPSHFFCVFKKAHGATPTVFSANSFLPIG